jgi:hypothetical protein
MPRLLLPSVLVFFFGTTAFACDAEDGGGASATFGASESSAATEAPQSFLDTGAAFPIDGTLVSPNGRYEMIMQGDGNLCVYEQPGRQFVWCSMSEAGDGAQNGSYQLVMQGDGNLCIYQQPGTQFWWCTMSEATDGSQDGHYRLEMQNDGNLCLYERPGAPHSFWCSRPNNTLELIMGAPNGSINDPMATVIVCTPGMTQCVTVPNIHVDTGSTGLRVFASALRGLPLPFVDLPSGGELGNCISWTPSFWGPVRKADVVLGTGLAARDVPIQVVDPSFGSVPASCGTPVAVADPASFNGIWGIGSPANDCESGVCDPSWNEYFDCNGSTCTATAADLPSEVVHLVPYLASDNNGLVVELPAVPPEGAPSVKGQLIFGIGTRANNVPPPSTKVVAVDWTGAFSVTANGQSYASGMDTGTWAWNLPYEGADACADSTEFLCPQAPISLPVQVVDHAGNAVDDLEINVESYDSFPPANLVFNDVGSHFPGMLMFGLPFFLGRDVYVGVAGQSTPWGTGPFFAYAAH